MAREYSQVNFRIPTKLKEKIEESASTNERSITAELVARLEQSFEPEIQVHETLEFKLMMQSYLDQAEQIKELKTMLEQLLKKG
ncbi:Arc family DNA-binding protein [Acinetobacter indicus]|uniref:Arc family DNA-binding protein n=1 Tax=Acinetobacter indicus TaxID=756892 RepID=UPI001FA7C375|nr:Arc family DNA-binding protein [Acinetobacter indicus]UNW10682.1 Arc family DNA-binding protein [Acinetobacter indicus]